MKNDINIFLIPAGTVYISDAKIVESEVFVYNLGTMFYIDKVLFTSSSKLPRTSTEATPTTLSTFTTASQVENIPEEIAEEAGSLPDVLLADSTTIENQVETETIAPNTTIK